MRATFNTTDTTYRKRNGRVVIADPLDESLYDKDETGPMFEVCDGYGNTWHAYADELTDSPR